LPGLSLLCNATGDELTAEQKLQKGSKHVDHLSWSEDKIVRRRLTGVYLQTAAAAADC